MIKADQRVVYANTKKMQALEYSVKNLLGVIRVCLEGIGHKCHENEQQASQQEQQTSQLEA